MNGNSGMKQRIYAVTAASLALVGIFCAGVTGMRGSSGLAAAIVILTIVVTILTLLPTRVGAAISERFRIAATPLESFATTSGRRRA